MAASYPWEYGGWRACDQGRTVHPAGICFDKAGNLYIADLTNDRVRQVNNAGIISTYAGNGNPGECGHGRAGEMLALDDR
jgi:hypothetical protein